MKVGPFLYLISVLGCSAWARQSGDMQPGLIRPGGLPVFFSSEGPLAYTSLTTKDLPSDAILMGPVTGHSCQFSLSVPITASVRSSSFSGAIGNGTYNKILRTIAADHPGLLGIYNVKTDLHYISVLGVFGKLCTEVTAEGYR